MNKVDVIITDSPIILSSFYNSDEMIQEELDALVMKTFNSYNNMNYFIERVKPYQEKGRFQTEEESDQIADEVSTLLDEKEVDYEVIAGDTEGYDYIVEQILHKLGK